ncbi:MAG: hypothetical protein KGK02_10965 [Rhodospirillales bacterium]|nr:hypothetical protein [Rhodospirillales bacterium]
MLSLTWVDWFNNRRIMEPIGNMQLAETTLRWKRSQWQRNLNQHASGKAGVIHWHGVFDALFLA